MSVVSSDVEPFQPYCSMSTRLSKAYSFTSIPSCRSSVACLSVASGPASRGEIMPLWFTTLCHGTFSTSVKCYCVNSFQRFKVLPQRTATYFQTYAHLASMAGRSAEAGNLAITSNSASWYSLYHKIHLGAKVARRRTFLRSWIH